MACGTRAQNADGYFVDLFCPDVDPPAERLSKKDIDPITAEGIDWLIEAPKVEETVIGSDGMPLYHVRNDGDGREGSTHPSR
jgi:hypothetical protein